MSDAAAQVPTDFAAYVAGRRLREAAAGLVPSAYALPGDLRTLRIISAAGPLRVAFDASVRAARQTLDELLGPSGVPLREVNGGALEASLLRCASDFGLGGLPAYVSAAAGRHGAVTVGTDEAPLLLLRPDLAEGLEEDELLFVFGRQCGHIHCRHTPLCTLLHALERGLEPGWGWTAAPLKAALAGWARSATLTADRAGLLACRDLDAAYRALAVAHLGLPALDGAPAVDELLAAGSEPRTERPRLERLLRSLRPELPLSLRADALELFSRSAVYRARTSGSPGGFPAAHLEERLARLLAGLQP